MDFPRPQQYNTVGTDGILRYPYELTIHDPYHFVPSTVQLAALTNSLEHSTLLDANTMLAALAIRVLPARTVECRTFTNKTLPTDTGKPSTEGAGSLRMLSSLSLSLHTDHRQSALPPPPSFPSPIQLFNS